MRELGNEIRTAAELVTAVEGRIRAGELAPGDRVDPVRAVASALGLAPNTVAAAYRALGERGFLVGQGRRGTFVADGPALAASIDDSMPESMPAGLVDLASGNPDRDLLPPLGPALDAMSASHRLYGAPTIDSDLAAWFRADLEADGVDSEYLAIVGGALDGLERVLGANLRPGDRVGLEDPGYPAVRDLVAAMGLRSVPLAVDDHGPRPEAVEAAVGRGIRAIVITPRAHNPAGAALDPERVAALARCLSARPEIVVIEDDHAGPVAGQPYQHLMVPGRTRWATVRSVAKSLGPDLRLAGLVGDETTIARVRGRQALGTGWVSHLLQRLVFQLVTSAEVQAGLRRAEFAYAERRAAVVEVLQGAGHPVQGRSGFNVWVPVEDEAQVVAGMERRGYALRSGARFRQRSGPGVRLGTAPSDIETLGAAARALVEVIEARPRSRSG